MGVRYVGKAVNVLKRLAHHRNEKGTTRKIRWLAQLQRHGLEPVVTILACVSSERQVWQQAEREWIAHYRAMGCDLVNLTDGGEGLQNPSQETRDKLAAIQRGLFADEAYRARIAEIARSPERRKRLSQSLIGRKHSPEHIAKLPQNQPGRTLPQDHRDKIAAALQGNQYARGLQHTSETRARISQALQGNKHTSERRMPEAEKQQRSETQRGRPKSEEHRAKIRQGQLAAWARRREEKACGALT